MISGYIILYQRRKSSPWEAHHRMFADKDTAAEHASFVLRITGHLRSKVVYVQWDV